MQYHISHSCLLYIAHCSYDVLLMFVCCTLLMMGSSYSGSYVACCSLSIAHVCMLLTVQWCVCCSCFYVAHYLTYVLFMFVCCSLLIMSCSCNSPLIMGCLCFVVMLLMAHYTSLGCYNMVHRWSYIPWVHYNLAYCPLSVAPTHMWLP